MQEGKITSSEQTRPDNNVRYTRFEFDTSSSSVKKNTFETILDMLDNEFTTEKFVMIASSQGIQEEVALNILENGIPFISHQILFFFH